MVVPLPFTLQRIIAKTGFNNILCRLRFKFLTSNYLFLWLSSYAKTFNGFLIFQQNYWDIFEFLAELLNAWNDYNKIFVKAPHLSLYYFNVITEQCLQELDVVCLPANVSVEVCHITSFIIEKYTGGPIIWHLI